MPTHFFKEIFADFPLLSTKWDGSDFLSKPPYQAIPLGGSRILQLAISPVPGGKIRLGTGDRSIFEIALPPPAGLFLPGASFVELDAVTEARLDLELFGRKPGRSFLVVEDMQGVLLDFVTIAVKAQVDVRYNTHLLNDSFNSTSMTFSTMRARTLLAEEMWLKQANIKLILTRESKLSFNLSYFGDPLALHKSPFPPRPLSNNNTFEFIQEELDAQGFKAGFLNLISTWKMVAETNRETLGDTPFATIEKTCYLANTIFSPAVEAYVCAHEIGHALGLAHNNHDLVQMMHEERTDSFLLNRNDIDIVNQSDRR